MMEKILLIGGGGHCHSVIDVIEQEGKYHIHGIIDQKERVGKTVMGYEIIGCDDDLPKLLSECSLAVITVGQIKTYAVRVKLYQLLKQIGYHLPTIVSPLAYVSQHANIGEGTVVMHHALVNAKAKIGKNCIINSKALIEHDAIIEDNCHISTASVINGGVVVKENTFFGSNSMTREYIKIPENSIVSGGGECLKIGYFADGIWSHNAFEKLIADERIKICFICVRFDTQDETLRKYAKKYNIDYLRHKNINSKEFIDSLARYKCDLFVSMSFNQIFKKEIIHLPRLGSINCHAGKLPFYRGRNILNWALINDEKDFGITIHFIDEGIDTGDIILQRTYPISDNDDYRTLLQMAHTACADVLYEAVKLFQQERIEIIKQDSIDSVGFYCTQRQVGDEILDWNQNSREVFNFVRAICSPGPKARAFINGKEMLINKVAEIEDAPDYKCIVGAILRKDDDGFLVKTKDSFVKVIEFEYQGQFRVGDRFE